jgi:hypothetical protein
VMKRVYKSRATMEVVEYEVSEREKGREEERRVEKKGGRGEREEATKREVARIIIIITVG